MTRTTTLALLAWAALFFLVPPALGQSASDSLSALCPTRQALALLVEAAAAEHRIRPVTLVAMMRVESTCDPKAVNRRTQSYGLMQIKLDGSANVTNATPDELLAPETSIDLGARHLRKLVNLCGTLAGGLGLYHGGTRKCSQGKGDGYAKRVLGLADWARRTIQRLQEKRS